MPASNFGSNSLPSDLTSFFFSFKMPLLFAEYCQSPTFSAREKLEKKNGGPESAKDSAPAGAGVAGGPGGRAGEASAAGAEQQQQLLPGAVEPQQKGAASCSGAAAYQLRQAGSTAGGLEKIAGNNCSLYIIILSESS